MVNLTSLYLSNNKIQVFSAIENHPYKDQYEIGKQNKPTPEDICFSNKLINIHKPIEKLRKINRDRNKLKALIVQRKQSVRELLQQS